MRVPYFPLNNPIPINFEERYHRYSAEGHDRISSVTQIKNKAMAVDFTWYREKLGRDNFDLVKNNIKKHHIINEEKVWMDIIGEIIGDYDMKDSGSIGTGAHLRCEEFLRGLPYSSIDALAAAHFNNLEPFLHEVSEIYAIEQPLSNKSYSYAGKPDLICKYRGKVTVLDFKTKKSVRKRDWIEDHFIQEGAYTKLWHDNNGPKVEQLVLLISSRDNQKIGMEFIEEDPSVWVEKWDKVLDDFQKLDG